MTNVPTLIIQFANEIAFQDIPHFRGAVIASMEKRNVLLHNHDGDKLRYSYPLIQYKSIHKKAAVLGIGKGIEVISQILTAQDFNYQIGSECVEMRIEAVNAYDNEILLRENAEHLYRLRNWLPLNTKNYKEYQDTESIVERIQILERILKGNILSFLKGIGIQLEEQISLLITAITGQRFVTYKKVKLMAFDIEFKTNIQLPQYIGIGKNASVGCGVLTKITNLNHNNYE